MSNNLLVEAGYPKFIGVGEAVVDAIVGFIVVFAGIALLIAIVSLVGKLVRKTTNAPKQSVPEKKSVPLKTLETADSDEISEETIAVVTAAIAAYYEQSGSKCEFKVRRIKKN